MTTCNCGANCAATDVIDDVHVSSGCCTWLLLQNRHFSWYSSSASLAFCVCVCVCVLYVVCISACLCLLVMGLFRYQISVSS